MLYTGLNIRRRKKRFIVKNQTKNKFIKSSTKNEDIRDKKAINMVFLWLIYVENHSCASKTHNKKTHRHHFSSEMLNQHEDWCVPAAFIDRVSRRWITTTTANKSEARNENEMMPPSEWCILVSMYLNHLKK